MKNSAGSSESFKNYYAHIQLILLEALLWFIEEKLGNYRSISSEISSGILLGIYPDGDSSTFSSRNASSGFSKDAQRKIFRITYSNFPSDYFKKIPKIILGFAEKKPRNVFYQKLLNRLFTWLGRFFLRHFRKIL